MVVSKVLGGISSHPNMLATAIVPVELVRGYEGAVCSLANSTGRFVFVTKSFGDLFKQ